MFLDKDLTTILFPVIGVGIGIKLFDWYTSRNMPPMRKALNSFSAGLLTMGILVLALCSSLPSTFWFESYNYPEEFRSLGEVHKYLQEHNRILGRLRDVIYWFLFFFAAAFLPMLYNFAKAMTGMSESKEYSND